MARTELRDQHGRYQVEGRRLLVELCQRVRRAEVAQVIGVTLCEVGFYCSGRTRPSLDAAVVLARIYGVSVEAWTIASATSRAGSSGDARSEQVPRIAAE